MLRHLSGLPLLLCATPAFAQETPPDHETHGHVSAGVAVLPEFDGSADYTVLPLVTGSYRLGELGISFDGLALYADLAPDADGWRFAAGPLVAYRFGRKDADDANCACWTNLTTAWN